MNDKRPHYDGGDLRRQGYRYRQDSERLTSRDKMQPVLLDMLTDDEPQKSRKHRCATWCRTASCAAGCCAICSGCSTASTANPIWISATSAGAALHP